jgi:transcriptional antiterminator RfaH
VPIPDDADPEILISRLAGPLAPADRWLMFPAGAKARSIARWPCFSAAISCLPVTTARAGTSAKKVMPLSSRAPHRSSTTTTDVSVTPGWRGERVAYWACVQLEPHRERLALHCLSKVNGFEIYSPRIRIKAPRPRREDVTRPLFPAYAFVLIVLQWHAARWSPGVVRIVLDGVVPAKVPDQVITELRARERGGVVQLPQAPGLRAGDRVRVTRGPFTGLSGLYSGQSSRQRIEILFTLLGGQRRVTLPRASIELVPNPGGS